MRPLELKAKITEPEEDEFDDIIEEENEEDEDDDDEPMQFNISSDRKDKVTSIKQTMTSYSPMSGYVSDFASLGAI